MGNLTHPRWGPPLEQYVRHYDKAALRAREVLDDETMSSALECINAIAAISEEGDETKVDLLAKQVTLEMLRSLLLLSSAGPCIMNLAHPRLLCGCTRLMKTVKVDGVVSPFSYEYGYICFNLGKMALGACAVEKLGEEHVNNLMESIWNNDSAKDNPSILTEYLSLIFMQDPMKSPPGRHDWILDWADSPAHGAHSRRLPAESEALDLMNILWQDRKLLLKSLSLTHTPGTSIISLLIWQYMLRKGALSTSLPQTPLRRSFLDLSWRFMLVATPIDYELAPSPAAVTIPHLGDLAKSVVDVEDSRAILNLYIKGILPGENRALNCRTGLVVYAHSPRYVVVNTMSGTEDLFPTFIRSVLGRLWEMISWEENDDKLPVGFIALGFQDLLTFFRRCVPGLQAQPLVMQAFLEEIANNDLLGLIGFAIHRLDPTRESQDPPMGKDYCLTFKKIILAMIKTLAHTSSSSAKPPYFLEYITEWLKHLQYNGMLPQMADNSENAKTCANFRRELLWDVIKCIGPEGVADEVNLKLAISKLFSCNYARCPDPSWAAYTQLFCSSCTTSPQRVNYCSFRCQMMDWTTGGQQSHEKLCPRTN